ncbi:maleylpyruvate isomerase family mycothiol-dependent enzyme [Gordonia sp. ABSL11-1]|uniref:maleylpyruvate isomerase family mycothiol-dependent enzyme n=1 Tax=Gordonia sp. ABSL11-1 TaxID=3053924 RepID=UPI002573EBC0|nr:maleylpyruvate isomerase family mycothiol-dependent enzyme [Gordonia sp. ABSL11-1]MDL9944320.1 maleylpyruvate isomerase family mycothiol-dependent enzyme [Gordonia sp. ABSL11-1]
MPTTILPIDTVVPALTDEWTVLDELVTSLTDEQWHTASVVPGWSVADIIAHVIHESMLAGRDVDTAADVSSLDHVRNPIGEFSEHWIEHFRGSSWAEVMAALREIVDVRAKSLRSMTHADFDAETTTPAGSGHLRPVHAHPGVRLLDPRDRWIHEIDIRDSTDGSTPSHPGAAEIALSEIAASLPFVIGKKAHPGGHVGAAADRRRRRARHPDRRRGAPREVAEPPGGDDSADVVLTMDVGGRTSAEPSRVVVDGEEAIGRALVENLAHVI